jgi:hypothetical protein
MQVIPIVALLFELPLDIGLCATRTRWLAGILCRDRGALPWRHQWVLTVQALSGQSIVRFLDAVIATVSTTLFSRRRGVGIGWWCGFRTPPVTVRAPRTPAS